METIQFVLDSKLLRATQGSGAASQGESIRAHS